MLLEDPGGLLEPSAEIPPRVLAIDDDPGSLQVLEAVSALAGFSLTTSSRPLECIELMLSMEPDVVLLDVMMPEITGFELCRRIKAHPDLRFVPVVLITALDSKEDRLEGLEVGCDDFMAKPFDRAILTTRVRSLARVRRLTMNLDNAEKVLEALARSVEAKDATTGDHCDRLTRSGLMFADHLGFSPAERRAMGRAGVLHDIGKIGIPDAILLKPGKLTEEEWVVMKTHTTIGADLLTPLRTMRLVAPIVRHHHERWDGQGYPDGLAGEKIPRLARAFQILDAFDALTSERPYKAAFTAEKACEILSQEMKSGKWDPYMLGEFLSLHQRVGTEAQGSED
jgi:putative two-component system response regulator